MLRDGRLHLGYQLTQFARPLCRARNVIKPVGHEYPLARRGQFDLRRLKSPFKGCQYRRSDLLLPHDLVVAGLRLNSAIVEGGDALQRRVGSFQSRRRGLFVSDNLVSAGFYM